MDELRDKVSEILRQAYVTNPAIVDLADEILALPEIAEALEFRDALRTPGKITLVSEPPIYTGERLTTPGT